jgi:hypothetical protein
MCKVQEQWFSLIIHEMADNIDRIIFNRFIPLCLFQEHNSINDLDDDMKKSRECISVVGMAVKRLTEH